jgi:hypothetical protein
MGGAKKDATNVFYHSNYSTLAAVWDACRKPLSDNGLAIFQPTRHGENGKIIIETLLAHSSGEWIMGELDIQPVKTDPQSIGSAITYARRYALAAMVGIAPEDDDAEGGMGRVKEQTRTSNLEPKTMGELGITEFKNIASTQLKQLGWDQAQAKKFREVKIGYVNLADMTKEQWRIFAEALCKEVENAVPKQN